MRGAESLEILLNELRSKREKDDGGKTFALNSAGKQFGKHRREERKSRKSQSSRITLDLSRR